MHLGILLTAMMVHGYTPDHMLSATISSIPKDEKGDLSDSENYKGIALTSCLCKTVDLITLENNKQYLQTSDLQFAFKKDHSDRKSVV